MSFDTMTSSIYCTFLNDQDMSRKSCNISYAPCGEELKKDVQGNTSMDRIQLQLRLDSSTTDYCYVVTANNDTFKILVQGKIEGKIEGKYCITFIWL